MEDLATKAALSRATEQLRGLNDFARDVLKAVILINGGAAIALLAFAASIWSDPESNSSVNENLVAASLIVFSAGVLFSGIASWAGYRTQYFFYGASVREKLSESPECWRKRTERLVGASFCSFVVGVLLSALALVS